jgi:hypothetical protein
MAMERRMYSFTQIENLTQVTSEMSMKRGVLDFNSYDSSAPIRRSERVAKRVKV